MGQSVRGFAKSISKDARNVARTMHDEEKPNLSSVRLVEDDVIANRKATNLRAEISARCSHLGMSGVEVAFLIDAVEKPQGEIKALALLRDVTADSFEVFTDAGRSDNPRHYFGCPLASSSWASSALMASISSG